MRLSIGWNYRDHSKQKEHLNTLGVASGAMEVLELGKQAKVFTQPMAEWAEKEQAGSYT